MRWSLRSYGPAPTSLQLLFQHHLDGRLHCAAHAGGVVDVEVFLRRDHGVDPFVSKGSTRRGTSTAAICCVGWLVDHEECVTNLLYLELARSILIARNTQNNLVARAW
jgi:hypothetical protein